MFLTFKYRIKDASTRKRLTAHARACNQVWNFCVSTQREADRRWRAGRKVMWPTAFDLIKLCAGATGCLGIHSDTVREICREFVKCRNTTKRCPRFRHSYGPKESLGWVPFVARCVRPNGDRIKYLSRCYRFWLSREVPLDGFKSGCFVQDARGRWYVCFVCLVLDGKEKEGGSQVGIDLGLKVLATISNGERVPALRHYRTYQAELAVQQRAGNKARIRAIHAKIANVRRNHLHEVTTRIARENSFIAIGNVSSPKLARTRMAKSVLDASWGMLRHQLRYKARRHGARYVEVDERFTSQTCSCCGIIPDSSPKGMGALGVRRWICSCGVEHDRDLNASLNILRVGLERQAPAVEIAA